MASQIRSKSGAAIAADFANYQQVIVEDTATGSLYTITDAGAVVKVGPNAPPTGTGFTHVTAGVQDGAATPQAGTGSVLLGLFPPVTKRKPTDQSITTSTVLANDADLAFPIAANEEWVATFDVDAGAAMSTTGAKVAITVPALATLNVVAANLNATPAAGIAARTTTGGAALTWVAGVCQSDSVLRLIVWVLNGVNAGSVTLQFAQNTSSASALTFRKGSFMQAARVA